MQNPIDVQTPEDAQTQEIPSEVLQRAVTEFLSKATHDDLKTVPAYNKTVQSSVNKSMDKLRKDYEKRLQETQAQSNQANELLKWQDQINALSADKFQEAMRDPRVVQAYAQAQDLKLSRGSQGTREQWARDAMGFWKGKLNEDERFADMPLDEWLEETGLDVPDFMHRIVLHGSNKVITKEREEMQKETADYIDKKIKEELEARLAEVAARTNASAGVPSRTTAPTIGTRKTFTDAEIAVMTNAEYEANRDAILEQARRQALGR